MFDDSDVLDDIQEALDSIDVQHANEKELRAVVERISDLVAAEEDEEDEDDEDEEDEDEEEKQGVEIEEEND